MAKIKENEMKILSKQNGTFRTNCKDCLDRTNLVQGLLGQVKKIYYYY